MLIDTEIKQFFDAAKTGTPMVRFSAAKGEGGQLWAAPLHLVREWLGMRELTEGQRLQIEIRDNRVVGAGLAGTGRQTDYREGDGRRGHDTRRRTTSSKSTSHVASCIPYGFVPVDPSRTVAEEPVLHDGSAGGELLSGEILCSLETLTPLLPGNARYPLKDKEIEKANRATLATWGFPELPDKKQIAEPLRLSDGRVVIGGSALKGMIRHSLSALLSAPMERVRERHFSYRPNLDLKPSKQQKYVVRPALVKAANNGGWDIEVFAEANAALFVRANAVGTIRAAAAKNGTLGGLVHGVRRDGSPLQSQRIVAASGASDDLTGYRIVLYKGGIDGQGLLAAEFQPHTTTYKTALVPSATGTIVHLSSNLYQRYLEDQERVLANDTTGHLTAHPLKFCVDAVKDAILHNAQLTPGQLIYVEATTDPNGKVTSTSKITSFGHHFRYRWAYTSSIRKKGRADRDCLTPTAGERDDTDGKPRVLTAARLMFGYVRNDKTNPIGKGVFQRLAGRIAVNHAMSEKNPKFLGDVAHGYCWPLPILGQPKPSAWEFYLHQDDRKDTAPKTYGDLLGDAGGDLVGRKYYRHQPYEQTIANMKCEQDDVRSDQATLARYIVDRGIQFKFTVCFARLREWELGALMAVLTPELLGEAGKSYAHKLGLGRPLGMGSIRIAIGKMLVRREKETTLPDNCNRTTFEPAAMKALKEKLGSNDNNAWLRTHEYPSGGQIGYPKEQARRQHPGAATIFDWHTNRRRDYSVLRRERDADWKSLRDAIQKVKGHVAKP